MLASSEAQKTKSTAKNKSNAKQARTGTSKPNRPAPAVATTRASAARAAAIRSSTTPQRTSTAGVKRKATQSPPAKPSSSSSSSTSRSQPDKPSAKKRPAWDIRGRMKDMEEQLKKDQDQIGKLESYCDGIEKTAKEKAIETEEVLRRIAQAKADLQLTERRNAQELEDLKAQHRIRRQELEDNHLIYKRKIASLELDRDKVQREMEEAERLANEKTDENNALRAKLSQINTAIAEVESTMHTMKVKIERADDTIKKYDQTIKANEKSLEADRAELAKWEARWDEEVRKRERLESTITELKAAKSEDKKKKTDVSSSASASVSVSVSSSSS